MNEPECNSLGKPTPLEAKASLLAWAEESDAKAERSSDRHPACDALSCSEPRCVRHDGSFRCWHRGESRQAQAPRPQEPECRGDRSRMRA